MITVKFMMRFFTFFFGHALFLQTLNLELIHYLVALNVEIMSIYA